MKCLQSLSDQTDSGAALVTFVFLLNAKLRGNLTNSFLAMDCLVAVTKVSGGVKGAQLRQLSALFHGSKICSS